MNKENRQYLVSDVREYSETVWSTVANCTSSKHHWVFIVKNITDGKRHCFDISDDEILNRTISQHKLVLVGDTIEIITEWNHYEPKRTITILK